MLNSEYSKLEKIAVCRPLYFNWSEHRANAAIKRSIAHGLKFDQNLAMDQYNGFLSLIADCGCQIIHLEPMPPFQAQVFVRDVAVMTPWGLVICGMGRDKRVREYAPVLEMARRNNIEILDYITAGALEGGDVLVAKPGRLLLGVSYDRSSEEGANQIASIFEERGWSAKKIYIDSHFVHLDTMFSMINADSALICGEVLGEKAVSEIQLFLGLRNIVQISYRQAIELCGNILSLDEERIILSKSPGGYHLSILNEMKRIGIKVDLLNLAQYTAVGGGPHCLSMPIARRSIEWGV